MIVAGLPLPQALVDLIHAGKWPCTATQANRVHTEPPLFPEARVRALAPEESQIYLCPIPLRTVAERAAGSERTYWSESFIPAGIDFGKAVVIGDFGLGSDAPILLDFRQQPPSVIRLRWRDNGPTTEWVTVTPDFGTFAAALDLWNVEWSAGA